MNRDEEFLNQLKNLPFPILVQIMRYLLKQQNGIEMYEILLNTTNFNIINCLFAAKNKPSLCLMNTRLWLIIINSMGYDSITNTFNHRRLKWDDSIIEYQRKVITDCLYTSRVHDLIDYSREGNQLAIMLLQRLANRTTDRYEKNFLLGKQPARDRFQPTDDLLNIHIDLWVKGIERRQIKYWDVRRITNMSNVFCIQQPLHHVLCDLKYWDVSNVTNMENMFSALHGDTVSFTGMKNWNTCRVTNMCSLLSNTSFNFDISNWDVSKVQYMDQMFSRSIFNNNIQEWDTSRVISMVGMFNKAHGFDQNIGSWDTSQVRNMSCMFYKARLFNSPLYWDTSSVIYMDHMFYKASLFNSPLDFDTSSVISMDHMFSNATNFNQDIGNWNTSSLKSAISMFKNATAFNQIFLLQNIKKVKTTGMFEGATSSEFFRKDAEKKRKKEETLRQIRETDILKPLITKPGQEQVPLEVRLIQRMHPTTTQIPSQTTLK